MAEIKLVAMDLDGTLLNDDKVVSERTAGVLRECEKRGVKMVIASGRGFEAARIFARDAEITGPVICANGARVEESPFGPTLMEDYIPPELGEKVAEIMYESGIYFVCYSRGVNYNLHPNDMKRGRLPKESPDGPEYTLRYSYDEKEAFDKGVHHAYKFVAFARDSEMDALAEMRRRIMAGTECAVSSSWGDNIEVLAPGAGKGKAISFLAARYGIRKEEIMAFGDQLNDKDMFLASGMPVAMANAVDELKACAAYTTLSNREDGVAYALEKFVLGR